MMPSEFPQPPPPIELSIPKECFARVLELESESDRLMGIMVFRQNRAIRKLQKGWSETGASQAQMSAISALKAYRRSVAALWDYLNHVLPDTIVGSWNLDSVRMVVTRKQVLGLQLQGGFPA